LINSFKGQKNKTKKGSDDSPILFGRLNGEEPVA